MNNKIGYRVECVIRGGGGSWTCWFDTFEEARECYDTFKEYPLLNPAEPVGRIRLFREIMPTGELFIVEQWKNPMGKFKKGELKELRQKQAIYWEKENKHYDA